MPVSVSAPLTTPTPNQGAEAQGLLHAAEMVAAGQKAIALVSPATPLGQAIVEFLKKAGKLVGHPPPETQVNSLQSQLAEAQRSAMQRMVQARQGGNVVQFPGAAPQGAGAPPPTPPMAA